MEVCRRSTSSTRSTASDRRPCRPSGRGYSPDSVARDVVELPFGLLDPRFILGWVAAGDAARMALVLLDLLASLLEVLVACVWCRLGFHQCPSTRSYSALRWPSGSRSASWWPRGMPPACPSAAYISALRFSSRICASLLLRVRKIAPRVSRFELIAPPFVEAFIRLRVPPDHCVKHAFRSRAWAREWRFAVLGGFAAGLTLTALAAPDPAPAALGAAPIAVICLAAVRPSAESSAGRAIAWLALVALTTSLAGLLAGGARLHAIDAGALRAKAGTRATLSGFVAGVPRRDHGEVEVRV